jgi:alpha-L-rhamnosidase
LAGINPDEKQPGYKNIIIRPQVIDAITWVKATKDTPYGEMAVKWEKVDGKFVINVKIPVGSTATVYMPNGEQKELVSGNHTLECNL